MHYFIYKFSAYVNSSINPQKSVSTNKRDMRHCGKGSPMTNFDRIIDRRNTSCIKWDKYKGRDVIPMWVADMDFEAPVPVTNAIIERARHGVFGYTCEPDELSGVIIDMLEKEYDWRIKPSWLVWLPGLVTGLNVACRTTPGKVVTSIPVYPPFLSAPVNAGKTLITTEHVIDNGRYTFDFDSIDKAASKDTDMFILCNPQNPLGRVFDSEELKTLAGICLKRGMVICSDEIHCGLVLDKNKRHVPVASICEDIAASTITLMAPSKTFNIPGLGFSFAVVPDEKIRKRFRKAMDGIVPHVNIFGYAAGLAAYRDCKDWHESLLEYLRVNRDILEKTIEQISGLSINYVEATYLAWIDCRELGLQNPAAFFEEHGVGLSDGEFFGVKGFVRLNFGCPRTVLEEALDRINKTVSDLKI
jgi:cysteine-S-conjugate beta-lyase